MNHTTQNSSRVSRLRKRFLDVLSGSVKLDPRGATLFLEGLCAQDDPVACLGVIIESPHGLSSVQSAMWFDLSVQFMNGLGSTVLEYLLRASDVGGGTMDKLLFHVVEPPIFWTAFVRAFQQGELTEDAQLVFAKLLSRLLTLQNQDTTPYRDVATQPFIEDGLVGSSKHEIREMGHLIKHILSSNGPVAACDVLNGPGGRHDNDFADYRNISILPTADEILCRNPPFLRPLLDDELRTSETPVEDYLDNTFRMLREDMLFDIREETQVASQKKGKHRNLRVIDTVSLNSVYTGTGDRKTRWGLELRCSTNFKELKKIKEVGARVDFLKRDPRGSRILKHQTLVCLASGEDIISFGTVNRVEELLAREPPVIVLQLDGAVNVRKSLNYLCAAENLRLIQFDASTFSFEPVLTALQKMGTVPLIKEILFWNSETPISAAQNNAALSHIAIKVCANLSVDLKSILDLPATICLDASQAKSLVAGLTKRVSLIQGPPGTGKSFIGTILAKAIHDKTSETILVVCYTNHALDQFLGDLLQYNIPARSMVRLGGRINQTLEHLSLHNQPRGRFRYAFHEIDKLKRDASRHEDKLQTSFDTLLHIDDDNALIKYLEHQHHDFFEAFQVPLETEDGMIRVGQNGKAIDEKYLFSRWIHGQDAGALSGDPHVQASARIWGMDHSARQQLLAEWQSELVAKATDSICDAGVEYNKLQDAIKQEFGESTVAILRQKRIIACTTTGAAIYCEAIRKVGPKFLLVEEAGEILESHILTALSREVDQMILIGDHKQLRPKVNNYQLTVERGEGFDLNRSLFERLVLKGYPHETLSTQHRMRPEISAFVRELTYPELIDAPSTHQRSDIRGVQSNVIFIDHDHPEDDDTHVGDRADGGTKSSKRNTHEVQMVLKIVRYLVQQGYKSEDIVVLTPYLGQLYQLRDALKRDNDPVLNDMDALDLARAGISAATPSDFKAKKSRIHLATIDNYQGEESNIVIASLTRSNKSNAIGFMDSPERLNVLLSRARDGLVLIGNSQTFLHSKKGGALWRRFFALLDKGKYAYRGFPIKCERHPEHVVLLKRASDFDGLCPDGGCTEPCGLTFACGHACPRKCHPRRISASLDPHDVSQCRHQMSGTCSAGRHGMTWECRSGRPSDCSTCIEEAKQREEIAGEASEQQKKREEAEAEHRCRMAELEATLRGEGSNDEGKVQEGKSNQVKEERTRTERQRKLQEEAKRRKEEKKGKEEGKKRREEKREGEGRVEQPQEATHQREDEDKENEARGQLQEAALGKQEEEEEERERQEKAREEEAERLREATRRRLEEEHERQEKAREEEVERVREATRKRLEEEARERQEKARSEELERLREATRRRLEEEEHRRQEEEMRKREEQTRRLQETNRRTQRRQVEEYEQEVARKRREEERQRREEETKTREEWTKLLQEGADRRRDEEHRRREEHIKPLLGATHAGQRQGLFEQPLVRSPSIKKAGLIEEITQQALERQREMAELAKEMAETQQRKQVALVRQQEERKRQEEERKRQEQEKKKQEKNKSTSCSVQ